MKTLLNEIKNIQSSKKELKKFGLTLGSFFLLWAGLVLWKKEVLPEIILGLAVFFILTGILAPGFLKPFQKVWMGAAFIIGWMMSRVILTLIFIFVITPISILTRLSGKDFMSRNFKEKKDTFWSDRVINNEELLRHETQF